MEDRKIERMFRSFHLVGQDSEESVATEYEDSFAHHVADSQLFEKSSASGSTQHGSRSIDYRIKYPALYSLEKVCNSFHVEDESNVEVDTGFSLAPRRLNTSSQKSSEYSFYSTQSVPQSSVSSISTAPASDDYDAEESSSSPSFEMVENFLNKTINESAATASSYADATGCQNNPHDTWQSHQDSFQSTASTSYLEIKTVLHKLSKIPNKKKDCETAESTQCFSRLSKSLENATNDFKQQLMTILEETQLGDDNSIGVFKEMIMKIIGKTRGIQDESVISFVNDHELSKVSFEQSPTPTAEVDVKAASSMATPVNTSVAKSKKIYRKTPVDLVKGSPFVSTPLRIAALTRGMDTPKSNILSPSSTPGSLRTPGSGRDLNESSFTYLERQCLGDKIPITPKPMPELTEEQKKLLAECHMKELELASESPYSSKSQNNCKSTDFDDSNHKSNELSPIHSEARGGVSDNLCDSLDDLDIEKEMAERDKRIAETEKTIKGIVNKKIIGSYSDEFLNIVNTYFDKSGSRAKSGEGLHDSGVETVSSARHSRKDKFSGSDSSLESRLDNVTLRKLSPSSINIKHSGRKRSPVIQVSKTKSATPTMFIVRNKSPLPGTKSRVPVTPKSTPRTPRRIPTPASLTPRVVSAKRNIASKFTPGKSVSSSKLSSALSVVADKSRKPAVASKEFKVPVAPPMILVTPSTPIGKVVRQDNLFSPMKSPASAGKIGSYTGGKYFNTPGKAPVAKKKTVFFPSPAKVNEMPKNNEIKKLIEKICPSTAKVRSPVADYIRGGRDVTTIKTIPKTQNEYLLSKEEILNYKPNVKVNDENYSPNSGFHYPPAVYRPDRPVREIDASPITPQGSRVKKLVEKKDSRKVIKHQIHQPDMSIHIKTVAEKKTAVTPRAYKKC
ncbi:uncharacterized protein LOC103580042 [Microplitis demolitor]|uniref:uncharacterized protein LOC103580042 n=1 Tax=Microplitis demolitor TaxID=69319 RepID=UPI0004CD8524|nr:uncharacterized protein LOC103580042 [Microplitis demolitor]